MMTKKISFLGMVSLCVFISGVGLLKSTSFSVPYQMAPIYSSGDPVAVSNNKIPVIVPVTVSENIQSSQTLRIPQQKSFYTSVPLMDMSGKSSVNAPIKAEQTQYYAASKNPLNIIPNNPMIANNPTSNITGTRYVMDMNKNHRIISGQQYAYRANIKNNGAVLFQKVENAPLPQKSYALLPITSAQTSRYDVR